MAIQQSQALPPQYVEDLQKDYGKQLTAMTAAPLDTAKFAPTVAGQDQYQQDAYTMAGQGIGAYQPYITQASAYTGPGSQQAFMSPYQQDVIDTTMTEYDTQAQKGMSGIGLLAAKSGNLGGGREGVMRGEYQNKSDLNRALLMAGLQQQGFGQAQKGAQQAYMNQMQMAGSVPGMQRADVAGLGSMGATQQAQEQAQLDAVREQNRLEAYEPYERLGYQGQGIASIASGAPGQYQSSVTPNPTPLQTALGTGAVLSGIYGNMGYGSGSPAFPTGGYGTGSDVRLKTDIEPIGQSSAGVNIYSFKYKGDDKTYQGVMAQEVPWASIKGDDGYYMVDYSKVDVDFKRLS